MLSVLHFWLGLTVVLLNLLAASWLGLIQARGLAVSDGARWALWLARAAVMLQALLGVFLTINGYVGDQIHYFFALVAIVLVFVAFRSPKLNDTITKQAATCAIIAVVTACAFLFGRMAS
jgi:hypothetical protein